MTTYRALSSPSRGGHQHGRRPARQQRLRS
jgi:hypothetical protein